MVSFLTYLFIRCCFGVTEGALREMLSACAIVEIFFVVIMIGSYLFSKWNKD